MSGLFNSLPEHFRKHDIPVEEITSKRPVSGGSINSAYLIDTDQGRYFVKVNSASRYPDMFEVEAKGLKLLSANTSLRVPRAWFYGEEGDEAFLVLEHIDTGSDSFDFNEQLAKGLAELHRTSHESFGLDYDNYIGSLPQRNHQHSQWADFFAQERLEPKMKMATEAGYFTPEDRKRMDRLTSRLGQLVPREKPSLLHGDLWSGNHMVDDDGQPVLIDPAVYYGHRETDLAMMQLFGGFASSVFSHYNDAFPLEKGWQDRIDLHNLYPLLVHVNLFGGGYEGQVQSILKRFS